MSLTPRRWMWVSLTLILLMGVSVGVIGDRLVLQERPSFDGPRRDRAPLWFACGDEASDAESHPAYPYWERFRDRVLTRLTEELQLRSEQVEDLEALLESKREGARQFWEETRTSYCQRREKFRSDIRGLLDPEQEVLYEELLGRFDARRAARRAEEAETQESRE